MKPTDALLVLPLVFCSCALPDYGVRVHAAYMQLEPNGNLALQDSSRANPIDSVRNDVQDGFDVDDIGTPVLRASLGRDKWDFSLSGFYYGEDSSSVLSQDFGDIPASTQVDTDLTVYNVKVVGTYEVLNLPYVRASAGLCLDYFDVDVDTRSVTQFENLSFHAPAPMIYGRATAGTELVYGSLELGWTDVDLRDGDGSYFDLDVMVTVAPVPALELFIGYRNILIDVDGDVDNQDYDTHLKLAGWYIGGGIAF